MASILKNDFSFSKVQSMQTKNYLCSILVTMGVIWSAELAETTITLHPEVEELLARTTEFSGKGYTDESDSMARQNTTELLTPLADRIATPAEAKAMVDVHLRAELYYAFNTQWGTGKTRDHRIVYDFLSQLNKETVRNANQKEHLTTFTVLSLAAQEYFWNEKTTVSDLRNRVKRELRYGLFKQTGHKLDISNIAYLDDTNLDRIITKWVDGTLTGKLRTLMEEFRGKSLGTTYVALLDHLQSTIDGVPTTELSLDLTAERIAPFGLAVKLDLKPTPSFGDGMCGEHSFFIPTDGALDGIQEGNGRYKIHRAILDNSTDDETKRLYLIASQHMDGASFVSFIEKKIEELRPVNSTQADELQEKLDTYQRFILDKQTENEERVAQSKRALVTHVTQLHKLELCFGIFNAALNNPAQLEICSFAPNFRNIIEEMMLLRTANAELNRLLTAIDADILRLDAEAKNAGEIATLAANTERAKAEKVFKLAQTDFEQFRKDNMDLIKEFNALLMKQQQLTNLIKNPSVAPDALETIKTALENTNTKIADFESRNQQLINDSKQKHTAILSAQKNYHAIAENRAAKEKVLAEKYILISNTLKEFISLNMLPDRSPNGFSVDSLCSGENPRYANFINGVCQEICTIVGDTETTMIIREIWDELAGEKEVLTKQMEQQLLSQRLEIAASLPALPTELSPNSLMIEMEKLALREGELDGWLPCDASYTQLWAILNNLNVFVFSGGEAHGRTPLDVMTRLKDRPYDSVTMPYPAETTGKRLATVILTSPTAKNIFLDKSPAHYDKFILPDDYAAIAREIRHVAWTKLADKYAPYP